MATGCYEVVTEWKSEETYIFGMILARSCPNLVYKGYFLDFKSKSSNKILVWRHSDFTF